ncbi:MAG: hypothetical protein VX265_02275 [Myxococcota bacterium]|nr:hypothetical protein [Myxococcota bacterium]
MNAMKQAAEVAAAATLATSFFAFPVWLAAMQVEVPITTPLPAPERVVHLHASLPALLSDEAASAGPADTEGPEPEQRQRTEAARDPAPVEPSSSPAESKRTAGALALPSPAAAGGPSVRPSAAAPASLRPARVGKGITRAGRRSGKRCLDPDPRIVAQGGDRFRIERDLVDSYTSDLKQAARLAWVGWHRDAAGDIQGFRVRRIRCGSVLHQAGFRNGDVVHAVNGKPVTSIPQALSAYRKLRKKRILNVEIKRRGAIRKLRFRLS